MRNNKPMTAIGLMSGTSLDGVDVAIIVSNGFKLINIGPAESFPYEPAFRSVLKECLGKTLTEPGVIEVSKTLTDIHVWAVQELLKKNNLQAEDIDLIGFHGHTILHQPNQGLTVQIGDPDRLAKKLGVTVIGNFRSRDVAEGGEGAPLVPIFHHALCSELDKPIALLNIGGVANVSWIGEGGSAEEPNIIAFDTGPGNALIDDWVNCSIGVSMDKDGKLANAGKVHNEIVDHLLGNSFFKRSPPKSLDRDDFRDAIQIISQLSVEDGAATLSEFSASCVKKAQDDFPEAAECWLITGGGRHNKTLMSMLKKNLSGEVKPIEAVGFDGDTLEAQAFAFLAIRSIYGLPLTLPRTTGVSRPLAGGTFHMAGNLY